MHKAVMQCSTTAVWDWIAHGGTVEGFSDYLPEELKADFGDRICFSGGVDEQDLLPNGSPEEVRAGVFKLLNDMARGGGFFIGPTHNLQDDIPTENILAMYEAAREWSY